EKPAAALAAAIGGYHEGQGRHQVRRYPQQDCALEARGAQPPDIGMLNVTDAAVYDLEAVGRGASGEVLALDERCVEAPQSCLARGGRAGSAASDHQDIEQFATQPSDVAANDRSRAHKPWMIANSARSVGSGTQVAGDRRWMQLSFP